MMSCNHRRYIAPPPAIQRTLTLCRARTIPSVSLARTGGWLHSVFGVLVLAAIKITSPMLLLHKLVGGAQERRVSCGIEARKEIPFYVQNTI